MNTKEIVKVFIENNEIPWEQMDKGVRRKIMAFEESLMLVIVEFETGGIGKLHNHYHAQISFLASGVFEVEISGEKKILKSGDVFYAPPNQFHGVRCIEAGALIDVFSPMREDFLK